MVDKIINATVRGITKDIGKSKTKRLTSLAKKVTAKEMMLKRKGLYK